MYSTLHGACDVKAEGLESATTTCPSPHTLVRHELYMSGWSASLNGRPVGILPYEGVFQQIRVPAGTSAVTFKFTPPHVILGYIAFLLGVACLVVAPLRYCWARRAGPRSQHGISTRKS